MDNSKIDVTVIFKRPKELTKELEDKINAHINALVKFNNAKVNKVFLSKVKDEVELCFKETSLIRSIEIGSNVKL
jgi:hypothetical protein